MNFMNMFGPQASLLGSGLAGQDIEQLTGSGLLGSVGNDPTKLNPQSQGMANQGMYQMPQEQQFNPMMLAGLQQMLGQQDQQQQMPVPQTMPIQIGGGQFSGMLDPMMRKRGLL